ncbi:MAG TPA: FAD-dependent oxidoreductase [bacterium]|nr:FAD-dependent oxidoreductase [bacterium]
MGRRILVVGGNAAGLSAAARAKREDPRAEVTVLEATETPSVSNCNFSYVLSGRVEKLTRVLSHPPKYFTERGVDLRTGVTVTEIDPIRRRVGTESAGGAGEEAYDKLVYCAGSRARRLDVPGRTGKGVTALHSYADMEKLVGGLEGKSGVAVIGGGFGGMSVAAALAEKRNVALIFVEDSPVPGLNGELSEVVRTHLEGRGVRLLPGNRVQGYLRDGAGRLAGVETDGEIVNCEYAVELLGVIPNVEPLGGRLELDAAGGAVKVDGRQCTSDDGVFAAGDCATVRHALLPGHRYIPNGALANRCGRTAGCNAAGGFSKSAPALGTRATELYGLELAQTGLSLAEARDAGYHAVETVVQTPLHATFHLPRALIACSAVAERGTGRILGVRLAGPYGANLRINAAATVIAAGMDAENACGLDYAYHPHSSPVWDPLLVLFRQTVKTLSGREE